MPRAVLPSMKRGKLEPSVHPASSSTMFWSGEGRTEASGLRRAPPSGCLHPRSGDRRGLVSTYALAGEGVEKLGPDTLRVGM